MAAPPPQAIPDDLVEEILLLLPPDEPAWLLRASLVCKTWRGIVSHRVFRRRLHELHGAPPVLGFLHNWDDELIPRFIPTTASSLSLAAPRRHLWRAIDCRHGRALFISDPEDDGAQELLLWEPITGFRQRVPVPEAYERTIFQPSAAVLCAADGCGHRDCLGGPFCLVFVFSVEDLDTDEEEYVTSACVYSSETGAWGELTSMRVEFLIDYTYYSRVLVARSLVYFMGTGGSILEYDFARHDLDVFEPPDSDVPYSEIFNLILMEDGGLGVSQSLDSHLKLWSREVATNGTDDARWVLSRVIDLKILLPMRALARADYSLLVLGFAEEANVIFVNTVTGLFTIELHSERARKVCDDHGFCNLVPVVGFYTPRSRQEALRAEQHHDLLPPLNITEEVGGEEEDKNLQWARKLFDKWCKDIEEGGFGNTTDFSSHTLEFRVPLPPERASTFYRCGRAFLHKARKATNHSRNGSKSSSNEESIRSTATASKDDTEVSEVFGSNVEQAPAENVDSEEGKNLNGKDQEDGNAAGGGDDSDLDMAWKMLNVARAIVTKNPGMTMEKFNIFLALAEVCKKRGDWDNTIGYYFKAFAILEHLVRPDNIRIVDINARICVAFELASKEAQEIAVQKMRYLFLLQYWPDFRRSLKHWSKQCQPQALA
ncbi:uncharacterized protein LOC123453177 isoform X2 [Hordeum vulgare subsp. vulgare]|uniref:uncharacterized protein LOC123453177 isoform X2 n=1 Tax=Hordeum vulgare subsp. vulgare TaxID=112509 RepID=UPI001D1A5557|nr:uncharacterized protein LOC123453177 isoform X2 [Hordeum vulgare subsp. vulgare]